MPAQKGANIGLGNQNKQGKDKTNPKINKNKQPYVGNPACKKHSVTNCQPKGRCSNKLVEKNIESVQISSTLNPKLTFKNASLDFKPPQAEIFFMAYLFGKNYFKKNLKFEHFGR